MALLALILYTPTSTAPAPASAPATSQPRDLCDSPCVVVNSSKVMPRRCQVPRACSGSSGTTAAGRFKPNHTSSVTAPISTLPARLRHQPICRDLLNPPLRESSRQIDDLRVVTPFVCANCVCIYIYINDRACIHAHIYVHVYAQALVSE